MLTCAKYADVATRFYTNMLATMSYWEKELAAEEMVQLSLPDTTLNNGTWMVNQAYFSVVRSMISREDTWHPRYGVMPGYGISLQDGFEDTFTATAMGALEMGAFPYAKVIPRAQAPTQALNRAAVHQ